MLNRLKSFVSTPTSSAPSTPGLSTPGDQTPPAPGSFRAPLPKAEDLAALREAVPCAECDACEDDEATATAPDKEQYSSFPRKFDMDQESEMLGTCSAYVFPSTNRYSPSDMRARLRAQGWPTPAARTRAESTMRLVTNRCRRSSKG